MDWAAQMGLPFTAEDPGCLDATLAMAWRGPEAFEVMLAGDGVVAARRHDASLEVFVIECEGSAPPYPIYARQPARGAVWRAAVGGSKVTRYGPDAQPDVQRRAGMDPLRLSLPTSDFDMVALFSDGVSSFMGPMGPVATLDVVRHLMAIRSPRGAFVTRRMRRFLSKTAPTAGWTHGDDVSMAAVALEG